MPPTSQRVLWIDDELSDTAAEVRQLREVNFTVIVAQTGRAGLSVLSDSHVDSVLLDLNLPDMSGLDVLEELAERGIALPIIVLTGFGDTERAVAAMKLGAVDFKSKPVDAPSLSAILLAAAGRLPRNQPHLQSAEGRLAFQADRMSSACNRQQAAALLIALLMDHRVTLRYFHACASALRLILTSTEPSFSVLRSDVVATIRGGLRADWPEHPKLLHALSALESGAHKHGTTLLAEHSGLSRAYLSRSLTKVTGRRPREWCTAAVLRDGLRVLISTPGRVSAIAYHLGYSQLSQFDREFVAMFGVPPRVLRRLVSGSRTEWAHSDK